MGRRRLLALAVLLPLLEPAAVGLSAWASTRAHECNEHSCLCARRCPPKRATSDCHGASPEATMNGVCHRGEAPRLGATTPYVLPAPPEAGPAWQDGPVALVPASDANPGFSRLDSPPPRSL